MAENHYNRATLDDLVRVEAERQRGRAVPAIELKIAQQIAHAALDAQLDVPKVLTRSAVRELYWKQAGIKKPDAPVLPKLREIAHG